MSDVSLVLNRYPFLLCLLAEREMGEPLLVDSAQIVPFRPSLLLARSRRIIASNGHEDSRNIFLVSVEKDTMTCEVLATVRPSVWRFHRSNTYRKVESGEQVADALLRVDRSKLSCIVLVSNFAKVMSCRFLPEGVVTEPVSSISIRIYSWAEKKMEMSLQRQRLKAA